jgi:hypothetical protein
MVAVQVALSLTALTAAVALVADGGILLAERRHAQAVADAAALAAAADLYKNYNTNGGVDGGSAVTSATNTANANGYTNHLVAAEDTGYTPGSSVVTVRVYPNNYLGGPNAGTMIPKGVAEATVTYYQGRTFSNVFGSGSIPISARAVARARNVNISVLTLNSSGTQTLYFDGSSGPAIINAPGAILVNSSDPQALDLSSSASNTLIASVIDVVGGVNLGAGTAQPTPRTGVAISADAAANPVTAAVAYSGTQVPMPNPLANLQPPPYNTYGVVPQKPIPTPNDPSPATQADVDASWASYDPNGVSPYTAPQGSTTIFPGRYVSIIVGDGCTVNMSPGIYYLTGNTDPNTPVLSVSGSAAPGDTAQLNGSGVLIYNGEQGGGSSAPGEVGFIDIESNAAVTLTPMTTGTWKGISIFQDRNASSATMIIAGGSGTNITGLVYAAQSQIIVGGANNVVPGSVFICDSFYNASCSITLPTPPPGARIRVSGPWPTVGLIQ